MQGTVVEDPIIRLIVWHSNGATAPAEEAATSMGDGVVEDALLEWDERASWHSSHTRDGV